MSDSNSIPDDQVSNGDLSHLTGLTLGVDHSNAPAFTFTSDSDTGFYRTGSGTIAFAVGGKRVITPEELKTALDHFEAMYTTGKITKEELIEQIKPYFEDDGLGMAEALENIQVGRENFIKQIKETI